MSSYLSGILSPSIAARGRRVCQFYWLESSGSVSILFGMTAVALMMFIGAAVDIGRWLDARSQTIAAADAAVLAGARALQTNGGDQAAALAAAASYYNAVKAQRLSVESDTIEFVVEQNGTVVATTGNARIKTPFMGFGGIPSLPLLHADGSDYPKAVLAVGQNAETNLETTLILDVSGSMTGEKVASLRAAATDLVNIVVWDDHSQFKSRVALVPYSMAVNAGGLATLARGGIASGTSALPGSQLFRFTNPQGVQKTFGISTCVSERVGGEAATDVGPDVAPVGRNYPSADNPCLANEVVPLSDDKMMLRSRIDALQASGSTGGHIGVAWGWYTLSPNWNSVWPSASAPASYSEVSSLNSKGQPKLKKIAVLMTDGEYNSPYCKGVISSDATSGSGSPSNHINCNAPNGSSYQQALSLCSGMKQAGIEVYTVGLLVVDSPKARDLLSQCATDASHYYVSTSGDELKQAFRDIALKISSIYLTQ